MLPKVSSLVLPALIRVEHWGLVRSETSDSGNQHFLHHGAVRSATHLKGNDLLVIEVQNRREIDLLAPDIELRDICYPFLMGLAGPKVTTKNMISHSTNLAPVGLIALGSHQRLQIKLSHKFLHGLVIKWLPQSLERQSDTPIAIPTPMLVEYSGNCLLLGCIGCRFVSRFRPVVVDASRQIRGPEQ